MATLELPDLEIVSAKVHDAWVDLQRAKGLTSRKSADDGEEMMVPYDQLSDKVKEYDRVTVRAVYAAILASLPNP